MRDRARVVKKTMMLSVLPWDEGESFPPDPMYRQSTVGIRQAISNLRAYCDQCSRPPTRQFYPPQTPCPGADEPHSLLEVRHDDRAKQASGNTYPAHGRNEDVRERALDLEVREHDAVKREGGEVDAGAAG